MSLRVLVALAGVGLLAACTGLSGSDSHTQGDQPVASTPQQPSGGDLRVGQLWHLATLDSVEAGEVTMMFEKDTVSGRAPVNRYFGPYTATDTGGLRFGALATTKKAGPPADMQAESAFLALLETVDGYAADGTTLTLFDDQAEVLEFSANTPVDPAQVLAQATALAQAVVGMAEDQATAKVEAEGFTWRVVSRDGTALPITEDYSTQRINATIVDGIVTEATVG